MIRVIMEFDDSWSAEDIRARVQSSQAAFSAERVIVENVRGFVVKDRELLDNHQRRY